MDIIYLTEKLFQHVLAVTPAAAVLIVMILMVRKWFGARISQGLSMACGCCSS